MGQGAQMLLAAYKQRDHTCNYRVEVLCLGLGMWVGVFAVGTAWKVVACVRV